MQWFKSAMVVSGVMMATAAFSVEGCSSNPAKTDGGDGSIIPTDGSKLDKVNTGDTGNTGTCTGSGAPTCENCDVSGFTPTAQVTPIGPKKNQCPAADITAFVKACFSVAGGSTTACQAWQTSESTSNKTCLSCVFTNTTGASWGPLVCDTNGCKLNVPGCLDLALNQAAQENAQSTGSCGDLLNASYGCQDLACGGCTADADFSACATHAVANECKTYADAFQNGTQCAALNSDVEPPNVSNCFPAAQTGYTEAELNNFVNFFCGQ